MNKIRKSEWNGPAQMEEVSCIENHTWKLPDTNNGYLKTTDRGEEQVMGPLLGTTPVTTVVQMSAAGTKTIVLPGRPRQAREKCLLAIVLGLAILSGICLLLLVNSKNPECTSHGKWCQNCLELTGCKYYNNVLQNLL